MTFTAPVLPQDKVIEQVKGLSQQRNQLKSQLAQLEAKLQSIESSLGENDQLKAKVHELLTASYKNYEEEWKRHFEYFPEIHLRAVNDMVAILKPKKKG